MIKLTEDLEKLTGVRNSVLNNLNSCAEYSIIDNILEAKQAGEEQVDFDIGYGIVSFYFIDDTIQYDFKPTKKFETLLIESINSNNNPLEIQLLESINRNIYKTYKDML